MRSLSIINRKHAFCRYVDGLVRWRSVTSRKFAPTRKATPGSRWIYGDGYIVFHPARRILVSSSHARREDSLAIRTAELYKKNFFDTKEIIRRATTDDWSLEDGTRVSVVRQKIVNDVIPRRAYQDYSLELDLRASRDQQVFRRDQQVVVAINRWSLSVMQVHVRAHPFWETSPGLRNLFCI